MFDASLLSYCVPSTPYSIIAGTSYTVFLPHNWRVSHLTESGSTRIRHNVPRLHKLHIGTRMTNNSNDALVLTDSSFVTHLILGDTSVKRSVKPSVKSSPNYDRQ